MAFMAPSPMELVVILVIALLVLGPKRLPETARSLGRGMRELRDGLQGIGGGDDDEADEQLDEPTSDGFDEDDRPELAAPSARRDDPGALPVDPAVVMGSEHYDDDLPGEDDLRGDQPPGGDGDHSEDEPPEDEPPGGEQSEAAQRR